MSLNSFAKVLFVNIVGRFPDPSGALEKLAQWIKFSRWCIQKGSAVSPVAFRQEPYSNRPLYFERIVEGEHLREEAFDYLEFGVADGTSLRWWRDHTVNPSSRFFGFDTFQGLPQDWAEHAPIGRFSTNGQVPVMNDPRFQLEVGMFQDTLPEFRTRFRRRGRLIVHLDADLYSSTLFVLLTLGKLLEPGDLLLFDEFAFVTHEFRAFNDFLSTFELSHDVAYAMGNFNKVCLRLSGGSRHQKAEALNEALKDDAMNSK